MILTMARSQKKSKSQTSSAPVLYQKQKKSLILTDFDLFIRILHIVPVLYQKKKKTLILCPGGGASIDARVRGTSTPEKRLGTTAMEGGTDTQKEPARVIGGAASQPPAEVPTT